MKLDVAQPVEVDGHQVVRSAIDCQNIARAVVVKAGRIEYMNGLAINGKCSASTGIESLNAVDRDACPRKTEECLRQRVNGVERTGYSPYVVMNSPCDYVTPVVVGELVRICRREIDPTVNGGGAAGGSFSGVANADIAVDRHVGYL